MKDSAFRLGRNLRAAALAMAACAFTGCILENPGPDPDLYRRFNVCEFPLYGEERGPFMRLHLERRDGTIALYAHAMEGARADSAEFYLYGDNSLYPFPLPINFPADYEVQARVKPPIGNDSILIRSGDGSDLRSDIRRMDWEVYVLREWIGDSLAGDRLGGLYAGRWSLRDHAGKLHSGRMRGLISHAGGFRFTFADSSGPTEVQSIRGSTVGDTALLPYFLNEGPFDMGSSMLDRNRESTLVSSGDSLRAVFPMPTSYGDSLAILCARENLPSVRPKD